MVRLSRVVRPIVVAPSGHSTTLDGHDERHVTRNDYSEGLFAGDGQSPAPSTGCLGATAGWRTSRDAVPERELRCCGAIVYPDLGQDPRHVDLYGVGTEVELFRDLRIAHPGDDQPQHLDLSHRQPGREIDAFRNGTAITIKSGRDSLRPGECRTRIHRGADGAHLIEHDRGRRA